MSTVKGNVTYQQLGASWALPSEPPSCSHLSLLTRRLCPNFWPMELVCLGCGSTFTNSQAYSTHKARYCIPRSDLGKAVSKRKAKAEAERIEAHARKRARREEEENARMEEVIISRNSWLDGNTYTSDSRTLHRR